MPSAASPLTILPATPSRGEAYAAVLQQLMAQRQQQQAQDAATAKAAEDARTDAVKGALTPYAGQPQLLARALQLLPPEDQARAKTARGGGFGIVPPMESPEQTFARTKAAALTQAIGGSAPAPPAPTPQPVAAATPAPTESDASLQPPPMTPPAPASVPPPQLASSAPAPDLTPSQIPDNPPMGAGAGVGVPPPAPPTPSPNDIVGKKVTQFEAMFGHAPAPEQLKQWYDAALLGPQGQVTAAQMASKIVPTAQENITNAANDRTFNQVTLPKSQAEIGNLNSETTFRNGPQTAETRAKTTEAQANTGKIGQETKALAATNDPVVRTVLGKSIAASIIQDPQSFFSLPMDDKKLVVSTLHRAPSKLGAAEVERKNAAVFGTQILDDATGLVDKWTKRGIPINGPVLGRFNEATGKWGDGIMPQVPAEMKDEYAGDIAQLRDWLTALPVQEAKALAGGRTAYQVIQAIQSVSPNLDKGNAMFKGSVQGLRTRFGGIIDTLDKKQWGGQPPVLDGGAAATPGTAAGPIQTFIGTDGKIHVR